MTPKLVFIDRGGTDVGKMRIIDYRSFKTMEINLLLKQTDQIVHSHTKFDRLIDVG